MRRCAIALVCLLGCRPSAPPDPTAGLEPPDKLVVTVAGELARLDHTVDLGPITVEVQPPQGVAEGVEGLLGLALSPSYYEGMLALRRAFAIEPSFVDPAALQAEVSAMKTPQLLAFYEPQRRAIVLRSDAALGSDEAALAVARALVHAFQDQSMGGLIASLYSPDAPADQARVRQCVLEGHASFVARAVLAQRRGQGPESVETFSAATRFIAADADRPCEEGARLVARAYARDGWSAVLRTVTTPPPSTEMVVHPEKRDIDFPVTVALPPWPEEKLGPAKLVRDDTIGELSIMRLLVERGFTTKQARLAATGWDGDHLQVYELGSGQSVVVWRTLWDREADAVQFRQAMSPRKGSEAFAWRVAHRGRLVQAVAAADHEVATALRDALGGVIPPAEEPDEVATTVEAEARIAAGG